jgi:hypothetical protein
VKRTVLLEPDLAPLAAMLRSDSAAADADMPCPSHNTVLIRPWPGAFSKFFRMIVPLLDPPSYGERPRKPSHS